MKTLKIDDVRGQWFSDMPDEMYHCGPGVSRSDLMLFDESPYKFYRQKIAQTQLPRPTTPAMAFGSLAHLAILQPHLLDERVIQAPHNDGRKKDYKDFVEANSDKQVVKPRWMDEFANMKQMIAERAPEPVLRAINRGYAESTWFTDDALPIKARPDLLYPDGGLILDLKTAASCDPKKFRYSVYTSNYHVQNALYSYVLQSHGIEVDFVFMVIEKQKSSSADEWAVNDIAFYKLPAEMLDEGYEKFHRNYNELADLVERNGWSELINRPLDVIELEPFKSN